MLVEKLYLLAVFATAPVLVGADRIDDWRQQGVYCEWWSQVALVGFRHRIVGIQLEQFTYSNTHTEQEHSELQNAAISGWLWADKVIQEKGGAQLDPNVVAMVLMGMCLDNENERRLEKKKS